MGSTDEAPSVARPHAAAPLVWRASYAVFALAATVFSLSRLRWAWPDAAWQTNLLDIEAVDHVLNKGFGGAMWIGVGGEHALTGYRWFQYFNAAVFGLDTQVELFVYFGLTLTLALAIGGRIFRDLDRRSSGWPARVLVFAIPVVLSTLVGAGSRGMEIGQFFGMTLFVVLALLIDSRMSTRAFLVVVLCTVPLAGVLVLGSYLGAPTIALVLVSLLQRLRPTVERPARPKLYVLTGTFLVSTVGWLLLMSLLGPSELDTGFGKLFRQLSHDPMFIPKYFLGGAAGSVISAQTLEVSGHGPRFAYAVGALVVLFAVACVVLAYRRAWRGSTVPLLLVLMPVCLVGTLLVGRSMDALWMLAPWYGFNLRLFLVGAIWLLVRALAAVGVPGWLRVSRALAAQAAAVVLLVAVLGVSVFANVNQWRRQPAERAYFQNIQWALLFPQELVVGENGYTPLILPLEESRRAIELLRKNHLSVYRDPQAVLAAMGDTGTYDEAATAEPDLAVHGMLDGTWAGPEVQVVVLDPACTVLSIDVTSFPAAVGTAATEGPESTLTVESTFADGQVVVLGDTEVELELHPTGELPEVELTFSRTWNPAALGLGADKRDLAALVDVTCG